MNDSPEPSASELAEDLISLSANDVDRNCGRPAPDHDAN